MSAARSYGESRGPRVAIVQSNYIPWKGYFDLIAAADDFVLYDDVQFTKNDWRNRNRIKTPQGVKWLSVPVGADIGRLIREVTLHDPRWQVQHWKTLEYNYRRAPWFDAVRAWLVPLYLDVRHGSLSQLNRTFIEAICRELGIKTRIRSSADFILEGDRSRRVAGICAQLSAGTYLSGPSARTYLDESVFERFGIEVEWFDYAGYPTYPQCWGTFAHDVTVLDLLFNCGPQARHYMKLGEALAPSTEAA
jgi:hypothetical protein